MASEANVRDKKSEPRLTVKIAYEDVLSAVRSWTPREQKMLLADLQVIVAKEADQTDKPGEAADRRVSEADRNAREYRGPEVNPVTWQHFLDTFGFDEMAKKDKKVSVAEMKLIIPPGVTPPTDEEVEEILMKERLARAGFEE